MIEPGGSAVALFPTWRLGTSKDKYCSINLKRNDEFKFKKIKKNILQTKLYNKCRKKIQ